MITFKTWFRTRIMNYDRIVTHDAPKTIASQLRKAMGDIDFEIYELDKQIERIDKDLKK